jgi:hypothetical protein
MRAVLNVDQIREDLGKVGPVIAAQVEEIISAGGTLQDGRFRRIGTVGEIERLLDVALPQPAPAAFQEDLQRLWPDIRDGVLKALDRRMQDRTKNLRSFLDDRMASGTADFREVLTELARSIRSELTRAEEPLQLDLWSDAERDQRDRDTANLRARLDGIPDEIAREEANIRRRYADPVPRLFPVAVTFLVPERLR